MIMRHYRIIGRNTYNSLGFLIKKLLSIAEDVTKHNAYNLTLTKCASIEYNCLHYDIDNGIRLPLAYDIKLYGPVM